MILLIPLSASTDVISRYITRRLFSIIDQTVYIHFVKIECLPINVNGK